MKYFMSDKVAYKSEFRFFGKESKIMVHTLIISYILPWSITVTCTFLTAIGLKRAREKRAAMASQTAVQNTNQNSNLDHNLMLTRIISFSLLSVVISNIPVILEYGLLIVFGTKMALMLGKAVDIVILVAFFCLLLGNSMDFYLFIVANQDFRSQLKKNLQFALNRCRPHD